ncbi:uncharacterized protein FIBRA_03409 [Fibroporia radiculosa]|uniref:Glycosyltransferase family 1 protein n=1 Tax=Fibroporia radiculosa TaxID=599839 RepID=J4H2E0_9APHY|nr:uncharacterized protein FIBRA_03409 [Fibroporia radiculosa]CCM01359.1 predicted protein [Fibroporia radiculosa]
MTKLRSVYITFFTTEKLYSRITNELRQCFEERDIHLLDKIVVISLVEDGSLPLGRGNLDAAFGIAYEKLVNGEPVECMHTGVQHCTDLIPAAVVVDLYGRTPLETVRRVSHERIKVFAWFAGAASILFRIGGPSTIGGIGDLRAKSSYQAGLIKSSIEEAAGLISLGNTDCLIYIPGLPLIYDHECQPQKLIGTESQVGELMLVAHDVLKLCDGLILATPEDYEAEATAALRSWFEETSCGVYACGPLISQPQQTDEVVETYRIRQFLESSQERCGTRSLLYFYFGSVHWPREVDKFIAILEAVMERGLPYILGHTSPYFPLSATVIQKVRSYDKALLTRKPLQRLILRHPVTAWYVTHADHENVIEAIWEGVPMICWPFAFDQPMNAARLSHTLDVAFELFQIRSSAGLKRVHRLGKAPDGTVEAVRYEIKSILRRAFGEDGKRKRKNVVKLQEQFRRSWDKRGNAWTQLDIFLRSLS